ncbi:MAG: IS110 family transposase, partial [Chloroflexota bacterium]
ALLNDAGKVKSKSLANDPSGFAALMTWLKERGADLASTHVCMESTGTYSDGCATALADAGWLVSVVNPAQPKSFGQSELNRNKTDEMDAALLARYCSKMAPPAWQPPPLEYRKLRSLVDRMQALKDMRQQEANRLEATSEGAAQQSIIEHLTWLDSRIADLDKDVDDHIEGNKQTLGKDAQLLTSIPGIGKTTAAKILGLLGDLRRFSSGKALAAFIGVTPKRHESGTSIRGRSSIGRAGHPGIRHALFMPTLVAVKHNPTIKAFRNRLVAAGKPKKSAALASMHKLVHLMHAVVSKGVNFDPRFNQMALDVQDGI